MATRKSESNEPNVYPTLDTVDSLIAHEINLDNAEEEEMENVSTAEEGAVKFVRLERLSLDECLPPPPVSPRMCDEEDAEHFGFGVGEQYSTVTTLLTSEAGTGLRDKSRSSTEKELDSPTVSNLEKRLSELEDEKGLIMLRLRNFDPKQKEVTGSRSACKTALTEGENLAGETQAQSESVMSQSMGSEESALSDDRFVKVKICEVDGSSKASSQSGKENLESEEQISSLTSECKKLRASLAESQEQYLKVKLELESHLLESQVQCNMDTKSSQEVQRLKDTLKERDDELVDLRILIEDALSQNNDKSKVDKKLTDMLSFLISILKEKELIISETLEDKKVLEFTDKDEKNGEAELIKLKTDLTTERQEYGHLKKAHLEIRAELESANIHLQELKDNEANIIAGYQVVSGELINLQQTYSTVASQLQFTQDELSVKTDVSREELDRLKEELLTKDEDMLEIQTCMDDLRTTLKKREDDLKSLNEKYEVQKLEFSNEKLKEVSANQNHQEMTQCLQDALVEKEAELSAAKVKIDKFKKVVVNLKRQTATTTETKEESTFTNFEDQNLCDNISDLKIENQKMGKEVLIISEEKQKLEAEIQTVTGELRQLEMSVREKDVHLSRSSQQVDELVTALDEKNSEIEGLVQSVNSKTQELTRCANLKNEEIQNMIQQYHITLENADSHARQLQILLDEKIFSFQEIRIDRNNANTYIEELQSSLSERDSMLKSFEDERREYLKDRDNFDEYMRNAKDHLEKLREIVEKKTNMLSQAQVLNSELVNEKKQITLDLLSKLKEMNELVKSVEAMNLENEKLVTSKVDLEKECEVFRELQKKNEMDLVVLKKELTNRVDSAEFDLIRTERDSLYEFKTGLEKTNEENKNQIEKLKQNAEELKQVRTERDLFRIRLQEYETHICRIKAEYERKSEEVEVLREMEVLAVKNELIHLKAEKEEIQSKHSANYDMCLRMESENTNLRNEIQSQEIALMETRERAGFFETEIRSVTHSTAHLETDINNLRETVIGLESQLAYANTQIQSFKEKFERERESIKLVDKSSEEITNALTSITTSFSSVGSESCDTIEAILASERKEKELLENKIELLQSKISEIEISEIKSFEECLMLKGWVRQLEMENLKYQDHLRALQGSKDGDLNNPKAKTLQDEVLRLVHTLQERDNRCGYLTAEITRLLEERDGLQLKLSNVLKQNVSLTEDNSLGQELSHSPPFNCDTVQKKLTELENLNYAINIDLRREKEARRLVQEQLLLSQNSRYYFGRGTDPTKDAKGQSNSPKKPSTKADNEAYGNFLHPTTSSSATESSLSSNPQETSKLVVVHI